MSTKNKSTYTIELTEAHLRLIAEFVEVTHRAICGQYKPLFDLIQDRTKSELSYDDKIALESLLLSKFQPKLETGASYSGDFEALGYQTYRDILEFFQEEQDKELTEEEKNSFLRSVYSWKQDQIAKEPKLKISKKQ